MQYSIGVAVILMAACANRPGSEAGEAGSPAETTRGSGGTQPSTADPASGDDGSAGTPTPTTTDDDSTAGAPAIVANVEGVTTSGRSGGYTFAVTLRSPDTGCDQYADWWEVLDTDGALLYRRILAHSHVDEQPFTRTGGPVAIDAQTEVWVRAHIHGAAAAPEGYGGQMMRGTVSGGFTVDDGDALPLLHEQPPLPESCAF
ncbi:MAG: hypothetical protein K0V04_28465 [Deltaproteobacteria bacterium]|nr:hypothetical protein [Deltaproteobacteria bacterium]